VSCNKREIRAKALKLVAGRQKSLQIAARKWVVYSNKLTEVSLGKHYITLRPLSYRN
jgi:hypothetical protein